MNNAFYEEVEADLKRNRRKENTKAFLNGFKEGIINNVKDPKTIAVAVASGVITGVSIYLKSK
jgi:F0F1-type ATP synthase assembly protein I